MKKLVTFICFFVATTPGFTQTTLQAFPLSSVRLLDGPFKEAQETDLRYILSLDPDRLLAPFLREAGISPKAPSYGNWENTGLDGHIGGHYLSALAYMYASTGNEVIRQRLDYMIAWLDSCQRQRGDGFVGGVPRSQELWSEISSGKINAASFSLNNRWVPLYNIHKTFAGLRDAYVVGGNQKAKNIFIKLCDWFLQTISGLSDDQLQDMLRSEHGGMNEVFADATIITGDKKYLETAIKLSHRRILQPLLQNQDSLTGLHANTQIPKVIGFERIAQITGDTAWSRAAEFFWNEVVHRRSVSIGGNSVREHFHSTNDFSSMIYDVQGPETCNTYNMLRLSAYLFLHQPNSKYIDYYERATYNHILSSQHPQGGFVYFTPMRPQHYRVYSQAQESFWCCVGSGLENHGKYGEMIYAHNNNDLFINLFIASRLQWKEKGLVVEQQTDFPNKSNSTIQLSLDKPASFGIYIRYPSWVKDGTLRLRVNGKSVNASKNASGYVVLNRTWQNGDKISIELPMQLKMEYLPDGSSWASLLYGPIVLAAKTDTTNLKGIRADDSRMGHVAAGKLYPVNSAPLLVLPNQNQELQLKPVNDNSIAFFAGSYTYPDRNLVLEPFYKIHDARYIIYWRVTDKEELPKIVQELTVAEQAKLALEEKTVDQVAPGEQQPEVEHNFKGERTESGTYKDYRWRNAAGWFSYELNNKNKEGKKLRITFSASARNVDFDILVNDRLLKNEILADKKGDDLFDIDYPLPDDLTSEKIEVKFVARDGKRTARLFYIRLMK